MADIPSSSPPAGNSEIASISAKIMAAAVIVVLFMIALLFLVHVYAKWYWSTHEDPATVSWRRRTARQRRSVRRQGLDPAALQSLPAVAYNPKDFKEGLECAVCLSEVSEGEKIRLLPKCNHGFHVQCIDMWFHSHSTCPLCRNPVVPTSQDSSTNANDNTNNNNNNNNNVGVTSSLSDSDSESDDGDDGSSYGSAQSIEAIPSYSTNVLFWGNETQVSSLEQPSEDNVASSSAPSSSGNRQRDALVIEIPREFCEDCFATPPEEDKSPMMTRLRSLKRLLSRGKRVAPSPTPSGSASANVEQV